MRRVISGGMLALLVGVSLASAVAAQQAPRPVEPRPVAPPAHEGHGTPKGWKLELPRGDADKGREAFRKFECFSCHEVKGERFPGPTEKSKVGPELSQMGPLHETDYFLESIVNPSRLIEKGKGYAAADGSSKMPSYNDSMTIQELLDLVAFLTSLKPPAGSGAGHRGH